MTVAANPRGATTVLRNGVRARFLVSFIAIAIFQLLGLIVVLLTPRMYACPQLMRMIAQPVHLTVRPNSRTTATMDPLSEVLHSIRLKGGVFLSAQLTSPWCIGVKITPDDCARFLAKPAQVIAYHVVTEGGLLVGLEREPMIEVRAGEIVLFPQNDPHILAS